MRVADITRRLPSKGWFIAYAIQISGALAALEIALHYVGRDMAVWLVGAYMFGSLWDHFWDQVRGCFKKPYTKESA